MKKLVLTLTVFVVVILSFQSCNKNEQAITESFETELNQKLKKLTNDSSDILHVYHQESIIKIDYESDGFVVGFAQGIAGKMKPICKSSNGIKFAKCVGKYVKSGNCCTISYDGDYYYAYPADCPKD